MLIITGTIRLPADRLDEARDAMGAMITASRAEPGCIGYSYGEDVIEPGLIRITELWTSRDHLAAHFETAHITAWRAQWARLAITDRQLSMYEAGEPQPV